MSSFCTAKATHIFSAKKFQHICISLDVNFNESLTDNVVSFEQLGPGVWQQKLYFVLKFGCNNKKFFSAIIKHSKNSITNFVTSISLCDSNCVFFCSIVVVFFVFFLFFFPKYI